MGRFRYIVTLIAVLAAYPNVTIAATFTVTKTADTNDGSCDADCSLREAIVAANANAGMDIVTVPAGTYVLSLSGAGEDAAATGDLDLNGDLVLGGAGAATTVIVGDGGDRVFDVDPLAAGVAVTISEVTVTNGRAVPLGGGIRNSGTLAITNSTISDNQTLATQMNEASIGGGIGTASGGMTTVSGCLVTDNVATGDGDAGPSLGGGIGGLEGEIIVLSSTVSENLALTTSFLGAAGGGIAVGAGALTLSETSVTGNVAQAVQAAAGGGVFVDCFSFTPCADGSVVGSTIDGNTATAFNAATGGGLYVAEASILLANITVTDNAAGTGLFPGPLTPTLGGGLALASGAQATVANATFEVGAALSGIDVDGASLVTFRNSIVADSCSGSGAMAGDAHNLEAPGSTCGFSGTDLIGVDPLLGPLADNGGPTATMALLPGSPAINGGNPAAPGSGGDTCEADDQRGVARPIGARCDIGAFESDCGDGGGDPGEQCDDGAVNGTSGSCCSASCLVRANGSPCEDGNVCTRPDTCQGGVCTSGSCATGACTICGGTCSNAGGPCECVF